MGHTAVSISQKLISDPTKMEYEREKRNAISANFRKTVGSKTGINKAIFQMF